MFPSQENSVRKVAALGPGLNDEITRFSLWTGIGSARSLLKGLFECVLRADLTAESARSLEKGSEQEYGWAGFLCLCMQLAYLINLRVGEEREKREK